jgi:predicted regulator of Ras-like GTPase activity (Roadblock/LC7/MglB family)
MAHCYRACAKSRQAFRRPASGTGNSLRSRVISGTYQLAPRPASGVFMANPQMVMYEEEFNQIQAIVNRLVKEANARVVFIIDKNGQLIAAAGDTEQLDTTSLASLTAGNIAATGGMAKLLRENEFTTQFHEGEKQNIHIQLVGNRVILVVIFDNKTSLGLVRLRVKKSSEELNGIFESLLRKVQDPTRETPFAEITDDDIDNLFND